jgi:hypothetical protein
VTVLGAGALVAEATGVDAGFREVPGIRAELETDPVAERVGVPGEMKR